LLTMIEPIMLVPSGWPRSEIPDGHGVRLRAFCFRDSGKLFDLTN